MRNRTEKTAVGLCAAILLASFTSSAQTKPADGAPKAAAIRHVFIVSVDGMMPESYTRPDAHQLKIPTLREIVAHGAWAESAQSVFPTVTYSAHTSIVTGMNPGHHGIVNNPAFDPLGKNQDGWRWYAEDIRVPTVWSLARLKGLRTAIVYWPVTVGAQATAIVPEYWRAGTSEDLKLMRAVSTPGLLEDVAKQFPDFWKDFAPPRVSDVAGADIAVHLIESQRPHLLLLHIFDVDHEQHEEGIWSDKHVAALENADAQIARLIAAAKKVGIWEQTALVIVSDHGFLPVTKRIRPGVLLRDAGLVTLDKSNHVTDWKACVQASAGFAYIYVKDSGDSATKEKLREIFQPLSGKPGSGVGHVYSQEEIAKLGGDQEAFLALIGADSFAVASGYSGELISDSTNKATHGFDLTRPELQASLLIYGPGIAPGKIENAKLIDVAPTVARWLGLRLGKTDGQPLLLPGRN
ncbi:MAG: alkaline phosphatase family protein [Acidobacteria bacterium]|nr:alkaline phosphatase family protein [Acidobacteriota bacterium]